jgi:hypothetical protein
MGDGCVRSAIGGSAIGRPFPQQNQRTRSSGLTAHFGRGGSAKPWPRRCGQTASAKTVQIGYKSPELAQKVPNFLPNCSPPVRRHRGGAAGVKGEDFDDPKAAR